jgi:hypothetical protein
VKEKIFQVHSRKQDFAWRLGISLMEVVKMRRRNLTMIVAMLIIALSIGTTAFTAYNHQGDIDSVNFRTVYPDKAGTKLDTCTLCHSGGSYTTGTPPNQTTTTLGSCQWCHYKYGYHEPHGNILETLNTYGRDYLANGRNAEAIRTIGEPTFDSDGDGYSNAAEIAATRYPGDKNDDPTKVPAPYQVYTREELEQMPQHTQFQLMNVTKSKGGDSYVQYSGVVMEELLNRTGMLSNATAIIVYSPDGFSYTHPLLPPVSQDPMHLQYFVVGPYPKGTYYYSTEADVKLNTAYGWCDYSAPSCAGRIQSKDGVPIPDELRMLLGIKRDGNYLTPGVLDSSNKLNGEGPFRVIPPQVIPGPPDQSSTSKIQSVIWPYNETNDHNAGASTRSTTIIKVVPLPVGTTDIDLTEAGWPFIDEGKILVYGAVDPVPTILEKLDELILTLSEMDDADFRDCPSKHCVHQNQEGTFKLSKCPQYHFAKWGRAGNCPGHLCKKHCHYSCNDVLVQKLEVVKKQVLRGAYEGALEKLHNDIQKKTDGCVVDGAVDRNDWVTDCEKQKQFYWALNEIVVLLSILI